MLGQSTTGVLTAPEIHTLHSKRRERTYLEQKENTLQYMVLLHKMIDTINPFKATYTCVGEVNVLNWNELSWKGAGVCHTQLGTVSWEGLESIIKRTENHERSGGGVMDESRRATWTGTERQERSGSVSHDGRKDNEKAWTVSWKRVDGGSDFNRRREQWERQGSTIRWVRAPWKRWGSVWRELRGRTQGNSGEKGERV